MAAIEKYCEYSGDYPGWIMYLYKRNHIQIMPAYRKQFRGKSAVLYIQTNEDALGRYLLVNRRHGYSRHVTEDEYTGRVWDYRHKKYDLNNCENKSWHPIHVQKEYNYALVVPDMPGNVNGVYSNNSCNISTVKRKLKRMLRCRKLEVRLIDELKNIPEVV